MKPLSNFVSLHPYFKVRPGKFEIFTAAFPGFVASRVRPAVAGLRRARERRRAKRAKNLETGPTITTGWVYLS